MLKDEQTVAFPIARADLEYWLGEWQPVILIVYDAQADTAYWLYVQAYFQMRSNAKPSLENETVTVYLSKTDVVDTESIRRFSRYKADVMRQSPEVIYYVF